MKFLAAVITTLTSVALADISAPFRLVLDSGYDKWDKAEVVACHNGAGINAMCVYQSAKGGKGDVFTFNSTANGQSPYNWTTEGIVSFTTSISTPVGPLNQTLSLRPNLLNNMVVSTLSPAVDDYTRVGFSEKTQEMALYQYSVDGKEITPISRWYICYIRNNSYQFDYLTWVVGAGDPDERSCVRVYPKRVFV